MPKISVIVPVYNTEKYLKTCLDSIVNQTYQDLEIIIVNDGSTDNSQKIVDKYIKEYPSKVKCIIKENGGLSSARNCGLEKATGKYISFVDSDDYIDVKLFEKLLPYIEKDIDLIKFKLIKVNEEHKELEKINGPVFEEVRGEEGFNLLVYNDVLLEPACIYLYKKSLLEVNKFRFSENTYHEDFGLVPIILLSAKNMVSVDFYGYYYVQASNSITRNDSYEKTVKKANDLLFHYDKMREKVEKINIETKTKESIYLFYINVIFYIFKKIQKKEKKLYIKEIQKRKLISNIKVTNLKKLIKKIILLRYI